MVEKDTAYYKRGWPQAYDAGYREGAKWAAAEAKRLLTECLGPPYADDLRLLIIGIGGSRTKTVDPAMEIAEALRARQTAIRAFLATEGDSAAGSEVRNG